MGDVNEALRLLEEATELAGRTGERLYEAELHRLRGEACLQQAAGANGQRRAEEAFTQALAVSRQQEVKSLELRAAMSLARLQRERGQIKEAREILAPVFEWFTQGLQSPDLIEARALLDSVSG
jgi:predicted ATPase